MTPIEDRAAWSVHRTVRDEMRSRGFCATCAEQTAFAATDVAEGKQPRAVELCERCKRIHERRAA